MVSERNESIDSLKGILIVLVIIGHIAAPLSLTRYEIDIFHMPLFIGISGYLFNVSKHRDLTLKQLIFKYQTRVLVPWIIAVFCYFLIVEKPSVINVSVIAALVKSFLAPYYHLWFVPAYLSWIIMTWLFGKSTLSCKAVLLIAYSISLFFLFLLKYPGIYERISGISPATRFLLHTFRPQFYIFFVLGVYFKRYSFEWNNALVICLVLFLFIYTSILFYHPDKILYIIFFVALNTLLIGLVIKMFCSQSDILNIFGIKWIGINSMGVYLWHVLPIFICKSLFHFVYSPAYYIVCCIISLLFLTLMTQLTKIRVFNKYFFGLK